MEMRVSQSELLMGAMYAPFCRTLYADPSEWDGDLKRMAEMGFNCIHGFTEWWRIEKEDGRFDFSETDALADCCQRHGIRLILNVATQNGVGFYMPRWMQRKYTGRGMVDCDGNSSAVPGEYVTACMDDPWYQYYAQRYLRAVATHYAGDSRVAGWVIWGEPSLTSRSGKPICYCEHTVARFRQYLRRKYGTIQRLNQSWGKEGRGGIFRISWIQILLPISKMPMTSSKAAVRCSRRSQRFFVMLPGGISATICGIWRVHRISWESAIMRVRGLKRTLS